MNVDSPIFVPRNNAPMTPISAVAKAIVGAAEPKSPKAAHTNATLCIGKGAESGGNNNSKNNNNNAIAGYWPFFGNATTFYANGVNNNSNNYLHYCQQQQQQHRQQQYMQQHLFQRQRTFPSFHNQWAQRKATNVVGLNCGGQRHQQQQQLQQQQLLQQLQHKQITAAMASVTALSTQMSQQRRKKPKAPQQLLKQQQKEQQKQTILEQQITEEKLPQAKLQHQEVDNTKFSISNELIEAADNLSSSQFIKAIATTETTTPTLEAIVSNECANSNELSSNENNSNNTNKNENLKNNNINNNTDRSSCENFDVNMTTLPPINISIVVTLPHQSTKQLADAPEVQAKKNDTVQRNSSRAGHQIRNTKYYQQQQIQQQQQQNNTNNSLQNTKIESSDSGIAINSRHQHQHHHRHQHHQQQQQQTQNQHQQKQRKTRSNSKRQDSSNNINNLTTSTDKRSNKYSVDDWREMVYCYDHRYMSSCGEDNMLAARHNQTHRNSTSSDAAASDDLHSSSSNEDLSNVYTVISQTNKKGGSKSRSRNRQQRQRNRKSQFNRNSEQLEAIPMDVDEDIKENLHPTQSSGKYGQHAAEQQGQQQSQSQLSQQLAGKASKNNLRKQCTKAAALKAMNKVSNNSHSSNENCSSSSSKSNNSDHAHALTNSPSNSSVCSSLSTNSYSSASAGSATTSSSTSSSKFSSSSTMSSSSSSGSSSASSSPTNSANCSPTASPTNIKRKLEKFRKMANALTPPLRQYTKLNMSESDFVQQLRRYIIDPNLLRIYGYPVESAIHDGCIEIYKCLPRPTALHTHHMASRTDIVNTSDGLQWSYAASSSTNTPSIALVVDESETTENVETTNDSTITAATDITVIATAKWSAYGDNTHDSGQGSADSSPPPMDSDSSEAGEDEPATTTACYTPDGSYQIFSQYDQSLEKQCVRCMRTFHVTEAGEYLSHESCTFHWGKLHTLYTGSAGYTTHYTCCAATKDAEGCSRNSLHVWTGAVVGINGPYSDFVHTRPRYGDDDAVHEPKVYALDCEMSFTGRGLEVTKVTVVGFDGQLVYEHFVRPEAEIVDYNTRFSGVTAKDLCKQTNKQLKTLAQVQRDLLLFIDADSILIGHGLDNDLRVLRIVHKTIVDTSVVFPHSSGFPYRRALKNLTKSYLNRDIQCGKTGHNSFEDSRACLELMMWKVRKDIRPSGY